MDGKMLYVIALTLFLAAGRAAAESPSVSFDVADVIGCADVTTENYAKMYSDLRLVEARFRISTRLDAGVEKDIEEVSIEILSPERSLRLVDFMPKTQLGSDVAGEIEISEDVGRTGSIAASIKPQLSVSYKGVDSNLSAGISSASIDASQTKKSETTKKYKLLPEKELLLASGTIHRGHGVYFKLKPSTQTSVQGWKELACIFEVPRKWKTDWIMLTCGATGQKSRFPFGKSEVRAGYEQVFVGLYLEGDLESRERALELAAVQEQHHQALAAQARQDHDSFFHRMRNPSDHELLTHLAPGRILLTGLSGPMLTTWWKRPGEDADHSAAPAQSKACQDLQECLESIRAGREGK